MQRSNAAKLSQNKNIHSQNFISIWHGLVTFYIEIFGHVHLLWDSRDAQSGRGAAGLALGRLDPGGGGY
jgi:hypothetical protein